MPDFISQVEGRHEAFYAKQPAWHGLGNLVSKFLTSEEAIVEAHLGWTVHLMKLFAQDQEVQERLSDAAILELVANMSAGKISMDDFLDQINPEQHLADEFFATVRSDNKKVLGVVKGRYRVVQNNEAFSFLDSFVMDGKLKYETAGALHMGRKVWMLAKMPGEDEIAEGDMQKRFLLFSNAHDGSGAVRCLPTSVRVVCSNTLAMALKGANADGVTIRHSGDIETKLADARKAIISSTKEFERVLVVQQKLAQKPLSSKQFNAFVNELFPKPEKEEGRGYTMWVNKTNDIAEAYLKNPTNQIKSTKRTAFAALNAITWDVDHNGLYRVGNQSANIGESRMMNVLWGSGAKLKQKALKTAEAMFV